MEKGDNSGAIEASGTDWGLDCQARTNCHRLPNFF